MLLQALHRYAEQRKLLDRLPFQMRTVHLLIPLKADGSVRGNGFVPLTTPRTVGEKTKEEPGRELLLPRFPGENNGGKAYYLAESFQCVLGVRKESGEPLPVSDAGKDRNPVRAFRHFWARIEEAAARIADLRLKALLAFRDQHLTEVEGANPLFDWLAWRPNESSREEKPEWHGRMATGDWRPIGKLVTVAFEIDGVPLAVPAEGWRADPIWQDWATTYRNKSFTEDAVPNEDDGGVSASANTICLVTGAVGLPVARSHKPKILGVPGLASGGYVVSFAKESPAFSSFGFEMGANAPVSEAAAASYALGLNDLLESRDTHFSVGGVTFCFWAEKNAEVARRAGMAIRSASQVSKFLKAPFAGIEGYDPKQDAFRSVALTANSGRVVVCGWLQMPVTDAVTNFKKWFGQLDVTPPGKAEEGDDEKAGPYSQFRLANAVLPKRKGENAKSARAQLRNRIILELYTKALDGTPVGTALLPRLLEEFVTALLTDNPKQNKKTFPLGQSRFALLKLILLRNLEEGEFMPRVHLATDTPDQAYNLGRLLAIFARLQKKAHEGKLEGPGVVQRYYAGAASSPKTVFPVLINLHIHHLRKLEQAGTNGSRSADSFRAKVGDVLKLIPNGADGRPDFMSVLTLNDQARFALGYYQQHAYDRAASRVGHMLSEARKAHKNKDAQLAELCLHQAKQAVTLDDYPDLFDRVNNFKLEPTQE